MLFISRVMIVNGLGSERYGVVDTDDWSESVIDFDGLKKAVLDCHLEIKGVIVADVGDLGSYISNIEAYQHERFSTRNHTKARVLHGVDIRSYESEITHIVCNGNATKGNSVIRLSDYGDRMSWQVHIYYEHHSNDKRLVLVLDDKVEMTGTVRCTIPWISWDIHELTNDTLVRHIYKALMRDSLTGSQMWREFIFDHEERMTEYANLYSSLGV